MRVSSPKEHQGYFTLDFDVSKIRLNHDDTSVRLKLANMVKSFLRLVVSMIASSVFRRTGYGWLDDKRRRGRLEDIIGFEKASGNDRESQPRQDRSDSACEYSRAKIGKGLSTLRRRLAQARNWSRRIG